MCVDRPTSGLARWARSPRPVRVGVWTWWPSARSSGTTFFQHQPPNHAGCTRTNVAIAGPPRQAPGTMAPPPRPPTLRLVATVPDGKLGTLTGASPPGARPSGSAAGVAEATSPVLAVEGRHLV